MAAMTEPKCRWDGDAGEYLTDEGDTCDTPKRDHCTARRTCSHHLAWGELTCARCVGRTRRDIRQIAELAALMLPEALTAGDQSEAAMLAGPGVDPRAWVEYRLAASRHLDHWLRKGRITERQHAHARDLMDDDEFHPFNVVTRWHMMLGEDYGHDLPAKMTLAGSAAYLDGQLTHIAQDENQDFRLFREEMRTCKTHLEAVIHNSQAAEKGAPCPTCKAAGNFVRLRREFPHYCDDSECTQQFHFVTDEADVWRCPAKAEHWWTPQGYADVLEKRQTRREQRDCCA